MTEPVEVSAPTVDEAIAIALEQLGAREDEVEIKILSDGGADPQLKADVRIKVGFRDERSAADHAVARDVEIEERDRRREIDPAEATRQAEAAQTFVRGLLDVMALDDVDVEVKTTRFGAEVQILGEDLAILIGRHGATLAAIQDVTRAAVQQATGVRAAITVDIEGYFERRIEILERVAASAADKVLQTGKPFRLEPMSSRERKIVHDAITGIAGLQTTSEGDDPYRCVVVLPA